MINLSDLSWVIDTKEMICRDNKNQIVVKMQKEGNGFRGKLQDMPVELFAELAGCANGERIIEKILKNVQREYSRVCLREK